MRIKTPTAISKERLVKKQTELQSKRDIIHGEMMELDSLLPSFPEEGSSEFYQKKNLLDRLNKASEAIARVDLEIVRLEEAQARWWSLTLQLVVIAAFGAFMIHSFLPLGWKASLVVASFLSIILVELERVVETSQKILNLAVVNEARRDAAEKDISFPEAQKEWERFRLN